MSESLPIQDREYYVQRLKIRSPDYVIFEAETDLEL